MPCKVNLTIYMIDILLCGSLDLRKALASETWQLSPAKQDWQSCPFWRTGAGGAAHAKWQHRFLRTGGGEKRNLKWNVNSKFEEKVCGSIIQNEQKQPILLQIMSISKRVKLCSSMQVRQFFESMQCKPNWTPPQLCHLALPSPHTNLVHLLLAIMRLLGVQGSVFGPT